MPKSKPIARRSTIDRSKLLGFDQLRRPSMGSQRATPQDLRQLSKVGTKRPSTR